MAAKTTELPRDALERQARAEARRGSLRYGSAKSFEELEAKGVAFWQEVDLSAKFQATIELVRDSWYLAGNDGPPPRLDRSAYGVRPLRS